MTNKRKHEPCSRHKWFGKKFNCPHCATEKMADSLSDIRNHLVKPEYKASAVDKYPVFGMVTLLSIALFILYNDCKLIEFYNSCSIEQEFWSLTNRKTAILFLLLLTIHIVWLPSYTSNFRLGIYTLEIFCVNSIIVISFVSSMIDIRTSALSITVLLFFSLLSKQHKFSNDDLNLYKESLKVKRSDQRFYMQHPLNLSCLLIYVLLFFITVLILITPDAFPSNTTFLSNVSSYHLVSIVVLSFGFLFYRFGTNTFWLFFIIALANYITGIYEFLQVDDKHILRAYYRFSLSIGIGTILVYFFYKKRNHEFTEILTIALPILIVLTLIFSFISYEVISGKLL